MRDGYDIYGHQEPPPKYEARREWLNEHCATGEIMSTTTEATVQDDVATLAKAYVTLRAELVERGERLRDAIKDQQVVVGVDGAFYQLSKCYCPGTAELPVRVQPVTLIADGSSGILVAR